MSIDAISAPSRIATPDEAITEQELQLAARNHGLPLEALRYDVTPPGLHYTLVHYDIPLLDPATWRLQIHGHVQRRLEFDLESLMAPPARTVRVTLECAGNGRARLKPRPISQPWLVEAVGTADWTGVPLSTLLDDAGVLDTAIDVVFTAADHGVERGVPQDYQRGMPLADAYADDLLLAYQMNGQPLPPQHGYPVRLIAPGWYGMAHVKWLTSIEVIDHEFAGFQNAVAYRLRTKEEEAGLPVTRIEPRALLIPPGVPDFMSRFRLVPPGPVTLTGRAWSGWGPVDSVEVGFDGGTSWFPAKLGDTGERWAWRLFTAEWVATPGEYVLSARATDASGRRQPVDAPWNRGGFANNGVQRIRVLVE
jgi:DMSO/TMAO reductase YedYZ molybdopterin-dependent catalytic subunit